MFRLASDGVFDTATAGTAAGALFHGQMLITSVVLLLMIATAAPNLDTFTRGARNWILAALTLGAVLLLLEMFWISPTIHDLRATLGEQYGTVSAAPRDDPNRKLFGMLHGLSMLRALGEMICATVIAVAAARSRG
jgi:hypothetical protein